MSRHTTCQHDPCTAPPLDRAAFCGDHIGVSHRCNRTREVEGVMQRCKKQAMMGLLVCEKHGGRFPNNKAQSERSKVLTVMQRFVKPRAAGTTLAEGFTEEFLRTLGRIDWLEEAISGLGSDEDPEDYSNLIWGKSKAEEIGAGSGADFTPGTNTTYEAKVHVLEEMLRWERVHLLNVEKLGIGAGLEQQRLDMMKTYASRVATILEGALDALGLDKHDPKVVAALNAAHRAAQPDEAIIRVEQIGLEEGS